MKRVIASLLLAVMFAATFIAPASAAPMPAPAYALAAKAKTTVTVTKAPGSVRRGATATVTIKTQAKTSCSIKVLYKSGYSTAQGLVTKKAPASGAITWAWKVGTRTTPGSWPVTITCGGISAKTYVKVP